MAVSSPWFLGKVQRVSGDLLSSVPELRVHESERNCTLAVGAVTVEMRVAAEVDLALSASRDVALLLYGEVYGRHGLAGAEQLLERYQAGGLGFVPDLDGSFALLIADGRAGELYLVTDRLASRKVYVGRWGDELRFASRIDLLPTVGRELDRTGLACYLANGVVHNNRTLFDGVSTFERACVHRLVGDVFVGEPYWQYGFDNGDVGTSVAQLQAELGELLVESVRKRLPDSGAVYLSLSAGFDATGILGVMGESLKVPDVACRSYTLGTHKDDDAVIAGKMAGVYKYDHQISPSYNGDLLGTIERNKDAGQAHAHFCEEVYFWDGLAPEVEANRGVVFVGDECFGIKDAVAPQSMAEVLRKIKLRTLADTPWLAAYLPAPDLRDLSERWAGELEEIVAACPPSVNLEDYRDYLYLDQRTCNVILPWRERFTALCGPVRMPLLDSAILDFMRRVPAALRRSKQLYKLAVTAMYPELFTSPRGRSGYAPAWDAEYARLAPAILDRLDAQASPLDRYVPPEAIAQLLVDTQSTTRDGRGLTSLARQLSGKAVRRLQLALGQAPPKPAGAGAPGRGALLNRLLVLRSYLAEQAARPTPSLADS